MKKILSVAAFALVLNISNGVFASSPVSVSSSTTENSPSTLPANPENQTIESNVKSNEEKVKAPKAPRKLRKNAANPETKAAKKSAKGDDTDVAIILALISVLLLPFGLHNWYLGRTRQALWQTLLVFPLGILIIPAIISWIWQLVDLFTLLLEGQLP